VSAIAKAFVAAKKAFAPALKSSSNPHFKSKYADLAGCLEAVNDALLEAGIAVYQETSECQDGVIVETVFLHESGETLRGGRLHVPAAKHDPQGYGSALTYARRYSLMAACGIAAEDDDGNAASKPTPKTTRGSNPLDQIPSTKKAQIPLMVPGNEAPLSFHADMPAWHEAYEALAESVARAGKTPARDRMTKLRMLREANEATLGLLSAEQVAKAGAQYKHRLAALGAAHHHQESDL
jgi:hypothetical protein